MTRKPEVTSARIASIAGRILAISADNKESALIWDGKAKMTIWMPWSDIRTLAASCLTQAPDKLRSPARHGTAPAPRPAGEEGRDKPRKRKPANPGPYRYRARGRALKK